MLNILTIDIEDYFQVHAFSDVIKFEDWGNFECRIERNTDRLLDVLSSSIRNPHSAFRRRGLFSSWAGSPSDIQVWLREFNKRVMK
jgi:hypothetical protein